MKRESVLPTVAGSQTQVFSSLERSKLERQILVERKVVSFRRPAAQEDGGPASRTALVLVRVIAFYRGCREGLRAESTVNHWLGADLLESRRLCASRGECLGNGLSSSVDSREHQAELLKLRNVWLEDLLGLFHIGVSQALLESRRDEEGLFPFPYNVLP